MDEAEVRERFNARYTIDPETGCWLWNGFLGSGGYGQIVVQHRTHYAHRISYELHRGPIPEGMQLDHLCRVRRCVNPDHLEPVTPRLNTLRGTGPTAVNAQKTHCFRGHPLTPDNLDARLLRQGERVCVHCRRQYDREYKRKTYKPKATGRKRHGG